MAVSCETSFKLYFVLSKKCGIVLVLVVIYLRAGDGGFPLATMSMNPGYFHRQQKERRTNTIS